MAKYTSLIHKGPKFPEEYKPHGYKLNGAELSPLAEEMIVRYAALRDTDYVKDKVLVKNFYTCFKREISADLQTLSFPTDPAYLKLIDEIFDDIQNAKAVKAARSKAVRDAEAAAKAAEKEIYGVATIDGNTYGLGSYQIEPPGIILTRGKSPIKGLWKYRTQPEDVEINFCDPTGKILPPEPPAGHQWKQVKAKTDLLSTFEYKVDVGHVTKRIKGCRFNAVSEIGQDADQEKYEKAFKLLKDMPKVNKLIADTLAECKGKKLTRDMEERRDCALALSIVKKTCIRIGNERDLDLQADTVGVSTLRKEMVSVDGTSITFNFLGKDSVPYIRTVEGFDPEVTEALAESLKSKKDSDEIFRCDSGQVNTFIKTVCPYASAKLFRTAVGTGLATECLRNQKIRQNATLAEKMAAFNKANIDIATLLNHQKAVAKNYASSLQKSKDMKSKSMETLKKAKASLKKVKALNDTMVAKAKAKLTGEELAKRLAYLDEKLEKATARVEKCKETVLMKEVNLNLKSATKELALGTSKTAYFSPMVVYSFCKKNNVPVDKIYTKALQNRFSWAADVDEDYYIKYPKVK